jgi:hypothetical protein
MGGLACEAPGAPQDRQDHDYETWTHGRLGSDREPSAIRKDRFAAAERTAEDQTDACIRAWDGRTGEPLELSRRARKCSPYA